MRACVCPCAFARVRPSVNTVNVEPGEKAKAGGQVGRHCWVFWCLSTKNAECFLPTHHDICFMSQNCFKN